MDDNVCHLMSICSFFLLLFSFSLFSVYEFVVGVCASGFVLVKKMVCGFCVAIQQTICFVWCDILFVS